jgi:hypothetical protein
MIKVDCKSSPRNVVLILVVPLTGFFSVASKQTRGSEALGSLQSMSLWRGTSHALNKADNTREPVLYILSLDYSGSIRGKMHLHESKYLLIL